MNRLRGELKWSKASRNANADPGGLGRSFSTASIRAVSSAPSAAPSRPGYQDAGALAQVPGDAPLGGGIAILGPQEEQHDARFEHPAAAPIPHASVTADMPDQVRSEAHAAFGYRISRFGVVLTRIIAGNRHRIAFRY